MGHRSALDLHRLLPLRTLEATRPAARSDRSLATFGLVVDEALWPCFPGSMPEIAGLGPCYERQTCMPTDGPKTTFSACGKNRHSVLVASEAKPIST